MPSKKNEGEVWVYAHTRQNYQVEGGGLGPPGLYVNVILMSRNGIIKMTSNILK